MSIQMNFVGINRESMIPEVLTLKNQLYAGLYEKYSAYFVTLCAAQLDVPVECVSLDCNEFKLIVTGIQTNDRDVIAEKIRTIFNNFISHLWINNENVDRYINVYDMLFDIIVLDNGNLVIKL